MSTSGDKVGAVDLSRLKQNKLIGVTMTKDGLDDFMKAIADLTKTQVMVGIPAEMATRDPGDGDEILNSQIGYINEFGLPEKNIPPRPHLVPGVEKIWPQAVKRLAGAANAALSNDKRGVLAQLNAIGIEAVTSVRLMITDTLSPPLSPKTIYKRQHRTDKPKRMGTQPLVDFGDYLRHISYVLRKVK